MRKQLLSSVLLMAFAATGFAQQSQGINGNHQFHPFSFQTGNNPGRHVNDLKDRLYLPNYREQSQQAERPTQIRSRMKSSVIHVFDGTSNVLLDSLTLFWNGFRYNKGGMDSTIITSQGVSFPANPKQDLILGLNLYGYQYEPDSTWANGHFDLDNVMYYMAESISHNVNGKRTKYHSQRDTATSNLSNYYKVDYTYDSHSNITSYFQNMWNGTAWRSSYGQLYSYNTENQLIGQITLGPDTLGTGWDSLMKWQNVTYNTQGDLLGFSTQTWNGNDWDNYSRFIETINNGHRVAEERQIWNNTQWVGNYKDYIAYDNNDNIITFIHTVWNSGTNNWDTAQRHNYTYDAAGHYTGFTLQNYVNGGWVDSAKEVYTYSGDVMVTLLQSIWNADSNAFINAAKNTYTYNSYNQCTTLDMFVWDGTQWGAGAYTTGYFKFTYETFDDTPNGINNVIANKDFQVYPNPASNQLTVKMQQSVMNQVRIVDMSGRIVFETKENIAASKVNVATDHLTDGIYLLQIRSGNKTGSASFVIKH